MLPRELQDIARSAGVLSQTAEGKPRSQLAQDVRPVAQWLLSEAAGQLPAAQRYLFFLKLMYETFHAISECFPTSDPSRAGERDATGIATSPEELLYIANHLYLLQSYDVAGCVLECGAFKGFSSCCLSHACAFLSRQLAVADSFQGLPTRPPEGVSGYQGGDFCGSLAGVQENVRIFGRAECVRYIPGWFNESLRGWNEPVALLWIDVDLYQSTLDVLENVVASLDPRGAIFSHEFLADRIREGVIVHGAEPPGALSHFFSVRGMPYSARHLCGWIARIAFPSSVGQASDQLVAALLGHLRDSDHRSRAARQAIGLRPALHDFLRRTRARLVGRTTPQPPLS